MDLFENQEVKDWFDSLDEEKKDIFLEIIGDYIEEEHRQSS